VVEIDMLRGPDELRAELRKMDDGGVLAQELVQKGAMHAVRFLSEELAGGSDMAGILKQMRESLRQSAMVVSEECARRGLPVIRENG
jgi:hypothetical protein